MYAFQDGFLGGRRPSVSWGVLALLLSGCAAAPMTTTGQLTSYGNMSPSNGVLAKSLIRVSSDDVLAARTIRIAPTEFAPTVSPEFSAPQRAMVANVIDRTLCIGLSDRFQVVGPGEPADLTTRIFITRAAPTNEYAAGTSKVVSLVPSLLGVPVPVPRLPIGLGSLTVEAEAQDRNGVQQAAMVWARGANAFTNSATASAAGDAYDLAKTFSADFSALLVTGATPFGRAPAMPSLSKIGSSLGGKPKQSACEAYGREPGVAGLVSDRLGLPPEWADKGAPIAANQFTDLRSE